MQETADTMFYAQRDRLKKRASQGTVGGPGGSQEWVDGSGEMGNVVVPLQARMEARQSLAGEQQEQLSRSVSSGTFRPSQSALEEEQEERV